MTESDLNRKYYTTLADGRAVYITRNQILKTLEYYRELCVKIIRDRNEKASHTPKCMLVNSFEEMMREISRITAENIQARKARDFLSKIDHMIFRVRHTPLPPNYGSGYQRDEHERN